MMTVSFFAAAVSLLAATVADRPADLGEASSGYVYFNRPGASLVTHNAELDICTSVVSAAYAPYRPKIVLGGTPTQSLIGVWLWEGPFKASVGAQIENCMVVRGWRAIRLPDSEGAGLAALKPADLSGAIEPWIGSEAPHGEIARVWRNDMSRGSTHPYASRPNYFPKGQLSLAIRRDQTNLDAEATLNIPPGKIDPKWPAKSLPPGSFSQAPVGSGVILVRLIGGHTTFGDYAVFERLGTGENDHPSLRDNAPDLITAGTGIAPKGGRWFAYAVPAGRWRLKTIRFANLCLGAPSFAVNAGEVVYAGTFDLGSETIGPDLTLGPAKAYLGGGDSSDALRAAVYANGSTAKCAPPTIYALEVPGAPFEPGSSRGSARATH